MCLFQNRTGEIAQKIEVLGMSLFLRFCRHSFSLSHPTILFKSVLRTPEAAGERFFRRYIRDPDPGRHDAVGGDSVDSQLLLHVGI